MDPMEVFKVEVTGSEEYGARKYREIIMDILQDLGVIRSIGRLYVYIDILKPLFAVYGLLRTGIPPLTVRDVGDVMQVSGGYQVKINDEEHMADLLQALWIHYGRERVEQPARDVVVIASDKSPAEIVVTDLEAEFLQDMTDALVRVAPEGFRNRRNEMKKDSFFFIAAEEGLTPETVSEVRAKIREMENA
ncbi:MAG TPA: methanogenesis marker 17 protein [Methanothrix sp.]|jgi:putative methanogenesis marker protein 17|nr:methanogenesis marker 17 protein [Methanothrix sp.]HPC89865.1 methanogenesis marker 17 protein [Methanothrix sp.]HQE87669.1 methanogenesis marker 17 protein [Methanothrix sp.]HQI68165.1 methanogenesis marker 17 protein [Methanothrix sp.]HRS85561.1 methanogenesis marker 17 protein [Methanothrix sp.]